MISSCVCQVSRDLLTHLSSLLAHFYFMSEENMNIIDKCGAASTGYLLLHEAPRILAGESVLCLNLTAFTCKETSTKRRFTHLQTPSFPLSKQTACLTTLLTNNTVQLQASATEAQRKKNKIK